MPEPEPDPVSDPAVVVGVLVAEEVFDVVLDVTGVPVGRIKPHVFDTVAAFALTHTSMTHSTAIF